VANHILAHADWEWPGGSDQYFANGGDCNDMTSQVASGTIIQGRFHTRLYQTPGYDLAFMWTVTGDAHFEYFCDFTHSVWGNDSIYGSGFDYAKYMLQYDMGMADEHTTTWWYWGNSQHMHQHCDQGGDYAWSDGWTAEIDMPYWYH
jgi:hypothetical protein